MPVPKVDRHSGAIIFHPTEDEVKVKEVIKENEHLKGTVYSLEQRLGQLERLITGGKSDE